MSKPILLTTLICAAAGTAGAQGFNPAAAMAAQRDAMQRFSTMDGVWRGTAWTMLPDGTKHEVTHTERVGPMLDGTIKVIEGKSYKADGSPGFNAFAMVTYQASSGTYTMHSAAQGNAADFKLTPLTDGYVWEIPAGPATIRYTAHIAEGVWQEWGERIVAGQAPLRMFEMTLKRVGGTDWPAANAVPAR
jgi:hypothetical protein